MDLITNMEAFIRDELLSHLQNELNDMQRDPIYEDADIQNAMKRLEQVRAYFGADRQAVEAMTCEEFKAKVNDLALSSKLDPATVATALRDLMYEHEALVDEHQANSASAGDLGIKGRAEEWRGAREPKYPTV